MGALAAPFAFPGGDYDELLRHVYTTTTKERGASQAPPG
jgi:hypothetical protein